MSYAAIDSGPITGAVYGVGATPADAILDAERGDPRRDPGEATYRTVPITDLAADYVLIHGGSPCRALWVYSDGVCLRDEAEIIAWKECGGYLVTWANHGRGEPRVTHDEYGEGLDDDQIAIGDANGGIVGVLPDDLAALVKED